MAFADAAATGYAPYAPNTKDPDTERLDLNPLAALSCDRATEALDEAIRAISDDDIPARCRAIGQATEAVTRLFLELEAGSAAGKAQFAGHAYEAILTHLVHINARNDAEAALTALALLERFREAWARPEAPHPEAPHPEPARPLAVAARAFPARGL